MRINKKDIRDGGLYTLAGINQMHIKTMAWCIWLSLCMLFNTKLVGDVVGSQVLLGWVIYLWIIQQSLRPKDVAWPILIIVFMIGMLPIQLLIDAEENFRLLEDGIKIIFLIFGVMALRQVPQSVLKELTVVLPVMVSLIVGYTYVVSAWDYYDTLLHRFGVPSFGSPNSLGYVLSFSLIMIHYNFGRFHSISLKIFLLFVGLVCLAALIGTQSRGGLITYLVGLVIFISRKRNSTILLYVCIVGLLPLIAGLLADNSTEQLARFNAEVDYENADAGSGRIEIWTSLIYEMIHHPISLVVGFGPGSIYLNRDGHIVNSAHSSIITVLYWYGLFGIFAFFSLFYKMTQSLSGANLEAQPWSYLRRSFIWMLGVGAIFDSYLLAAQLLWFAVVIIAIIFVRDKKNYALIRAPSEF
ncbi:MAG: O-antigen ligase family protein [Gammaproteobacteria bacterium]|nr:O-antigen ligase family protein [Gammaproteobacteria bacterium]